MGILASRRKRRTVQAALAKGAQDGKRRAGRTEGYRNEDIDYIQEFLSLVLQHILPDIAANGTKIITNAGALDPLGCKVAIENLLHKMNIHNIKVAAVVGDDMLGGVQASTLNVLTGLKSFSPLSVTQHALEADRLPNKDEPIVSLNAYLGAQAIASALDDGAHIVVTGRVVDSALVVGPLLHEFRWNKHMTNYYDLLASASLAGHIIECGCQATGGNFTDWTLAAQSSFGGYANMGYPIVEMDKNGNFIVTKPERTGGLVTPMTVAEQIVYEILDPAFYILPDVILDLRQVSLTNVGPNRVHVQGAKGRSPTPWLKCSGIFVDGWKMTAELFIAGQDAKKKGMAVGDAIVRRVRGMYKELGVPDFYNVNIEPIGSEVLFGSHTQADSVREICLRITVHHPDPKALKLFAMEVSPAATTMVPGVSGGGSGRPRSIPNLVHFPCLVSKSHITARVTTDNGPWKTVVWEEWEEDEQQLLTIPPVPEIPEANPLDNDTLVSVNLIHLACGRSGDKGDVANIGVIARDPAYLPYLKRSLTAESVAQHMKHVCKGTVTRFELPGLAAFNFVLTRALGGGGLSSLMADRQGKTFAQILLCDFKILVPSALVPSVADAKL